MFDTTKITHESKVVAVTKEIEKTISPDKVTEMYDAVKEEVEQKILRSYVLRSSTLEAAVLIMENRYISNQNDCVIRFVLNGKEHLHRFTIDKYEIDSRSVLFDKVFDLYRDAVTKTIMNDTISTLIHMDLRA